MERTEGSGQMVVITADIVASFVANNRVERDQLPALIASVHASLQRLGQGAAPAAEEAPQPAVPVKRSVTPDYIICLEDGKRFKSLRRHLRTAYDMTPEDYRARWGLPADYPMVAPNYAASRSALAKSMGLGRKPETENPDDQAA
ncbi:MucR family transcriptional regulator [Camelimonas fluminis]|uniref:MucR family transcriptional regulator n=1 Tax=Camelimonas fluminis TaxID=1576911 RepID=A0ABV7UJK4_9HYPH|nr:MucR family transcriptional regulator [Camelimonas fluminis]GHE67516.1 MucR family transcriptional regulator [Camelimonas fluminis]